MRRIAHLSDLHFDRVNPDVAEALLADVRAFGPNLVIVSGDLTQRARPEQFEQAMKFIRELPPPRLVLAGNHDVPLWNVWERMRTPLQRYHQFAGDDRVPTFQDPEMIVVGLNTASRGSLRPNGFWKDGSIDLGDLPAAVKLLKAAPARAARIVVTHHPFAAFDDAHAGDAVRNGKDVLPILRDAGVELLLAGHLHRAYTAQPAGILAIQSGTSCSDRLRDEANSYNRLTIEGGSIGWNARQFGQSGFEDATLQKFNRGQTAPVGDRLAR